jgi:hypothetical protein
MRGVRRLRQSIVCAGEHPATSAVSLDSSRSRARCCSGRGRAPPRSGASLRRQVVFWDPGDIKITRRHTSCTSGRGTLRTDFRRLPRTLRAWQLKGTPATELAGVKPNGNVGSGPRGEAPPASPPGPTCRRAHPLMAVLDAEPLCPAPGVVMPSRHGLEGRSRSGARSAADAAPGSKAVRRPPGGQLWKWSSAGSRSVCRSRPRDGTGRRFSASWPANWRTAVSTTATSLHWPRH